MDRVALSVGPAMDMPIMHNSDRYELVKDIGSGKFGAASLVRDKQTTDLVAVKHIGRGEQIFEVGDIVVLDPTQDVGAVNHRRLAALYCGAESEFELMLGLVERFMEAVGIPLVPFENNDASCIGPSKESEFLPDRQFSIFCKGKKLAFLVLCIQSL